MQLPVGWVVALLFASGLLLSRIQFCLVAAVAKARKGHWDSAQAITLISLGIGVVLVGLLLVAHRLPRQLAPDWGVLAGALLFGVAAAFNRGCFIGTSIQLAGGDLSALYSVMGWVLGFLIVGSSASVAPLPSQPLRTLMTLAVLALLLGLSLLTTYGPSVVRIPPRPPSGSGVQWRASIACGAMLGLIDNDLWRWDPSSLAQGFAGRLALLNGWQHPAMGKPLGLLLIAGMACDALMQGRWRLVLPSRGDLSRLPSGMAMAAGASLAMGGNDSELLRYLPSGSPHSWVALPAMVLGVLLCLRGLGRLERQG